MRFSAGRQSRVRSLRDNRQLGFGEGNHGITGGVSSPKLCPGACQVLGGVGSSEAQLEHSEQLRLGTLFGS
jgi:hypothetical protein